ncbi:hypothetical protein [Pseudooceanicola nanhaiensis]|uniref:hypothetical protein n=1 Tax=Pseudooceanicola nanhaiensis TaxID=375761 RepID=UPI004059D598
MTPHDLAEGGKRKFGASAKSLEEIAKSSHQSSNDQNINAALVTKGGKRRDKLRFVELWVK